MHRYCYLYIRGAATRVVPSTTAPGHVTALGPGEPATRPHNAEPSGARWRVIGGGKGSRLNPPQNIAA
jgi:hypothetical protein